MKKKLLFVTLYLHTGGVEKSLLSLLSSLDYKKYEVDLLLFDHSGVLFEMVPPHVNILPPLFETYSTPLTKAVPELIKAGHFRLLTGKLLAATLPRLTKGMGTGIRWKIYRHTLNRLNKHYDVAISYLDLFCNYYVTEKVSADKKIVYNHMDYAFSKTKGWTCEKLESKSFQNSDYIVTVAESSRKSLEAYFPELSRKMHVIHNTVSTDAVRTLANEATDVEIFNNCKRFKVVTVARLGEEKGVFLALEACKILVDQGIDINWFLVGNGQLKEELKKRAIELGLEKHFILLGEQSNPYPFMGNCDIYVQPSKTEAHCVAVEEAIALSRPIVVTNIPSFKQQIKNEETGLIVNTNAEGIAKGIKRLYCSKEIRDCLIENLQNATERNKKELEKFNKLLIG